jgi:predicted short-subunit dehydrogenase-like oxidoreductase (DUF2520 family)
MTNNDKLRVGIVGSGNVATHLATAIAESEHELVHIISRDRKRAESLAQNTGAVAITIYEQFAPLDIIILAIKDEALGEEFINHLPSSVLICHTSGSVAMDVLSNQSSYGIFYPLQTFSKQKEVDFNSIPICLEANNSKNLQTLHQLAQSISNKVYEVDSAQRKALHIAAVFACNFTNLMYDISEKLCKESGMDFEILRPLIQETAAKVQDHIPSEVQTGPAARNDQKIIEKHQAMLTEHPDYQNIYKILTNEIIQNNEEL